MAKQKVKANHSRKAKNPRHAADLSREQIKKCLVKLSKNKKLTPDEIKLVLKQLEATENPKRSLFDIFMGFVKLAYVLSHLDNVFHLGEIIKEKFPP